MADSERIIPPPRNVFGCSKSNRGGIKSTIGCTSQMHFNQGLCSEGRRQGCEWSLARKATRGC